MRESVLAAAQASPVHGFPATTDDQPLVVRTCTATVARIGMAGFDQRHISDT